MPPRGGGSGGFGGQRAGGGSRRRHARRSAAGCPSRSRRACRECRGCLQPLPGGREGGSLSLQAPDTAGPTHGSLRGRRAACAAGHRGSRADRRAWRWSPAGARGQRHVDPGAALASPPAAGSSRRVARGEHARGRGGPRELRTGASAHAQRALAPPGGPRSLDHRAARRAGASAREPDRAQPGPSRGSPRDDRARAAEHERDRDSLRAAQA